MIPCCSQIRYLDIKGPLFSFSSKIIRSLQDSFITWKSCILEVPANEMSPTRVGIIGLGISTGLSPVGAWGVNAHLRSIQGLSDEYEIVAVANSSVESAQRTIEYHKLPITTKAYGSPEDIAADPNVELVVIAVEVRKHHFLAMPALRHKKSVFVEWPLGANTEQAEELTKLAAENGVKTMVGLQGR